MARIPFTVADPGFSVNLQIGFHDRGAGILGSTGSHQTQESYISFQDALGTHQASADDTKAVRSLDGAAFHASPAASPPSQVALTLP